VTLAVCKVMTLALASRARLASTVMQHLERIFIKYPSGLIYLNTIYHSIRNFVITRLYQSL
jgi:hypothetical protein